MSITSAIKDLASVDIFQEAKQDKTFVGRPFYLDYDKALLLIADAWKMKVGGIPQGAFLLAFYENEKNVSEALLLRALKPTKLPTENDVICSVIEYYKDNLKTMEGKDTQLDDFTRYEFSFSGLECRILGTFYKDKESKTVFGADVENFYSAHNYSVYKPTNKVLEVIANLRDGDYVPGNETDIPIGVVRYSSSLRFQENLEYVSVYISPKDFLGKRTALFGMTRTGKSNTVKKIIQATVEISNKRKDKVGQIIFDVNGEYANPNLQDEGTAIFELFNNDVIRYSVINKTGFKVMKVNFYNDILSGFELIRSHLADQTGDYVKSLTAIDLSELEDTSDQSKNTRYERIKAAYLCCLYQAGFEPPQKFKVYFKSNKELKEAIPEIENIDPSKGITLEEATNWFTAIWDNYNNNFFNNYKLKKNREWADEDLKALLIFLTRKKAPGGNASISGYRKLRNIINLHTDTLGKSFEVEIIEALRDGKIIIIDLSQGDPSTQKLYSEGICRKIFNDSMNNFIKNELNNFIQFYFEEAHNLFPKKDDKQQFPFYLPPHFFELTY